MFDPVTAYIHSFPNREITKYLIHAGSADTTTYRYCHTLNPLCSKIVFLTDVCFHTFECTFASHDATVSQYVFMVALWNSADHYIFILSFVLSSFFLA